MIVGGGGATSALEVSGALRVRGAGKAAVQSVVKVVKRQEVVLSGPANSPRQWDVFYAGELDEVLEAFVVVAGFGLTPTAFNTAPPHHPSTGNIPQYVWATCDGSDPNHAWGRALCSESDPTVSGDNHVAITVIVIGRKYL